ncbi:MAG TPA: AbrB/MazE/SpoVT family DNA-binding domain-containing protein [Microthrixaceae bacterium]|nr:AbrB/MazE/SpoVT family DNA-binding domain-containing protein [Microthrixaceae bacterium]
MATTTEFLVSKNGQMSVPADVRRRWGLVDGGPVTVMDLGDFVVLIRPGAKQALLGEALPGDVYREHVASLDDPDLETT